jgi:hypothetical protein
MMEELEEKEETKEVHLALEVIVLVLNVVKKHRIKEA